ncbi:MAG: tetratricopeptide repeat protein, partial [Marinicella sp.]
MLYPNLKHWAVVLCLSLNLAAANDQSVDDIQALISSEPEKGLVQAKQFWQDKAVNADNLIAGILMISAYTANAQYAPAKDLLDQFLSLETLAADQTGLLLAMKLNNARKSKSTEGLANTIAHVKTVLVDMNEQKDLASRNKALFELNQEMGFQHYYAAEFETAEPYFIEAYNYIDVDDKKSVSNLLNTIGVVYAQQAKLAQAAQYMFDSLKMLEDNDLPVSISRYQNLGSLYFGLKDYDKTIEYSQKALEIDHKPNKSTVSLYSNMAAAQIEKGLVDEAIKNLKKSIEISTELGTTSASARNNLGYMYKQAGQYDQALEQLNLSAQELDDAENSELRGVSYKSRADVYAAMENYDQALEFYEQAQLI